ncbi:MAG: glycosyltransferase [Cyanobacteriota bacterium]
MTPPEPPPSGRGRLSLSMIVRNEAERLEACLRSVAGFVDEMVVVDTGSSDGTVAIAERCGASVHQIPWPGDFAPARNQALQWLSGDWVLVLDADEQLLPAAREPLQALMARPELLLINLLRFEAGASQSPYSSVSRLFRRHPAIHWSGTYHSMVDASISALLEREPHWRIADCPEPALHHDGYRPELLASGDKAARLRQAMEAELAQAPHDPYASAKLGALEVAEGNRARGLRLLEDGLRHCPATAHPERFELLQGLALALSTSDPGRAAGLYQEALQLPLPARITLAARINLAGLLLEHGQPAAAHELAQQACGIAPELPLCWYQLGLVERQLGRLPAAAAAYDRALDQDPRHAASTRNRALVALLLGDIPGARSGFLRAITLLESQGQADEAADLRRQAGGLVRLDP